MSKEYFTFLLFIFISIMTSSSLAGQEICDNGIDDDGDGLVDLNDDDCACPVLILSGLIPNPSFEDMTCCPNTEGELDCAVSWIQASRPTTDYVHTCGTLGNPFLGINAPQPFPDGEGGIGFRDGKPGNANFKEYAGACLTEAMEIDLEYKLDFFVGFASHFASRELNMGVFVTTNCNNLPFGNNDQNFGCPMNGPGWTQLGEILVSGNNEWVNVVYEFTVDQPYAAIVLGPACAPHPIFSQDPYFFMDRLTLEEKNKFGVPFAEITGSICEDDLTLVIEGDLGSSYQWYFNGIAIPNETEAFLTLVESPEVEGIYSAVITDDEGCFDSQDYVLTIPSYSSVISAAICDGDVYPFGTQNVTEVGEYEEDFVAADGCDSTVFLTLSFLENTSSNLPISICEADSLIFLDVIATEPGTYEASTINAAGCDSTIFIDLSIIENTSETIERSICDGEIFSLLDVTASEAGSYQAQTTSAAGCDSTITILLDVVPANEGITLSPFIEIELGASVSVEPDFTDPEIISYEWTTTSGVLLSTDRILDSYQALFTETLLLSGVDNNGCPAIDSIELRVDRNVDIYIPNVFTPNNDGNNDNFSLGATLAVIGIESLSIYDRWGNLVYDDKHEGSLDSYEGWNGKYKTQQASEGVYIYHLVVRVLGDQSLSFSGNVTLLR